MNQAKTKTVYKPSDEVDFVIVGSGAAGGVLAKELSTNGFRVVVLEQGPYIKPEADFTHDEIEVFNTAPADQQSELQPMTFRKTPDEKARLQPSVMYGRCVGGSSVHFTANFWRFHEIDLSNGARWEKFPARVLPIGPSLRGPGAVLHKSGMGNWRVRSGGASPFDPPRSKPYPMPPLPVKGSGVVFERARGNLAITRFPRRWLFFRSRVLGAIACVNCGFCLGFGCEVGAKSSSLSAMIPVAEAHRALRDSPQLLRTSVAMDKNGRATGVVYFDAQTQHAFAKSQSRDSLREWRGNSAAPACFPPTSQFPNGLANSSGHGGKKPDA